MILNHMFLVCLEKHQWNKIPWKIKCDLVGYQKARLHVKIIQNMIPEYYIVCITCKQLWGPNFWSPLNYFMLWNPWKISSDRSVWVAFFELMQNVKCFDQYSKILYLSWIFWGFLQRVCIWLTLRLFREASFPQQVTHLLASQYNTDLLFFCIVLMSEYLRIM